MKTVVSSANSTTVSANAATNTITTVAAAVAPTTNELIIKAESSESNLQKRPASLDLNKSLTAKKQRLVGPSPLIVDTPDLLNAKPLNTPDLEKMLLSSNLLPTPQPGLVFPTKVAGVVTSEQEAFGKGFEEALNSLHNSKNAQGVTSNPTTIPGATITTTAANTGGMSGGSFTYTNLESFPVAIKDEPQNGSNSPPVSPIDMETQEKIKLERKRQRNRVAASKCRKRKLERISKLEEKVKQLKAENADLGMVMKNLKEHVAELKQEVMEHYNAGCLTPAINSDGMLLQSK